jgi:hypothetical protein
VGDGSGFEANHFLVVEAFGDTDVQNAMKLMYPEGWDVNSYARMLPATDAALRAVAAGDPPYTAAMHRGGDGAHAEVNDFQTKTIGKIAADVNAERLTPAEGRARMDALFEFMLNTSVNADPAMVTTYWDSDDPRLKAMIGLDPDRPLDSDAKKAVRKKVQGLLIEGYGEIKVIEGKKTVVYDENIEELVARQDALAERLENGAKVLDDGSDVKYILWNQEFAQTGAKVLELDKGSSIIQAGAIAIYAYGVQQSGALDELNLEELDLQTMIRLLGNSSLQASVSDGVKNIAVDMGFEVVVSGIATALGVGLLWKAYEIYESLDALTAALEFASRHSDNAAIDSLQGLVGSVKVRLDQWFGAGETPAYQDIANLIVEEFPIAEQTLIRDAILDFAVAFGVASGLPRSDLPSDTVVSALQLLENITLDLGLDFSTVVQFALMAKPALVWGDVLSRSMFDIERTAETMDALDRALAGPEMFVGYSVILAPSLAFLGTADPAVRTEVLDWMAAIITTAAGSLAGGVAPDTAAHLSYITLIPTSDRDNDGNSETTDVIRAAAALTRDYGAGHAGITQAMAALTQALVTRTSLLLDTMDLAAVPESAALEVVTARARQLMVLADIWGQTNLSLGQTLAKGVAGIAVALAGKAQEVTISTVGAAEALIDQAVIIAQELRALQGVDPTQDVRTIATAAARAAGQIGAIATSFDLDTAATAIGFAKRAASLLDDLHAEFSTLPGVGASITTGARAGGFCSRPGPPDWRCGRCLCPVRRCRRSGAGKAGAVGAGRRPAAICCGPRRGRSLWNGPGCHVGHLWRLPRHSAGCFRVFVDK